MAAGRAEGGGAAEETGALALATGRRNADRGVAATSQFHFVLPPHTRISSLSFLCLLLCVCGTSNATLPRPLFLTWWGTFFALRLKSGNAYPNT